MQIGEKMRVSFLRKGFSVLPFVLAGILTSGVAMAKDVYECSFEQKQVNGGWVPEASVIAHDPGAAMATLSDPYVLYVHERPMEVKVAKETAARLTLSDELKLPTAEGETIRVGYRLTLYKQDMSATLVGHPMAADNRFDAWGGARKNSNI